MKQCTAVYLGMDETQMHHATVVYVTMSIVLRFIEPDTKKGKFCSHRLCLNKSGSLYTYIATK